MTASAPSLKDHVARYLTSLATWAVNFARAGEVDLPTVPWVRSLVASVRQNMRSESNWIQGVHLKILTMCEPTTITVGFH